MTETQIIPVVLEAILVWNFQMKFRNILSNPKTNSYLIFLLESHINMGRIDKIYITKFSYLGTWDSFAFNQVFSMSLIKI